MQTTFVCKLWKLQSGPSDQHPRGWAQGHVDLPSGSGGRISFTVRNVGPLDADSEAAIQSEGRAAVWAKRTEAQLPDSAIGSLRPIAAIARLI